MWIFNDNNIETIRIQKGTPQDGWMSLLFIVTALEYIIKQKDSITAKMLFDGKLLTFADEIKMLIKPNEIAEIPQVIDHIVTFGLMTNPIKFHYVCP